MRARSPVASAVASATAELTTFWMSAILFASVARSRSGERKRNSRTLDIASLLTTTQRGGASIVQGDTPGSHRRKATARLVPRAPPSAIAIPSCASAPAAVLGVSPTSATARCFGAGCWARRAAVQGSRKLKRRPCGPLAPHRRGSNSARYRSEGCAARRRPRTLDTQIGRHRSRQPLH
jgi:hypothetical protein